MLSLTILNLFFSVLQVSTRISLKSFPTSFSSREKEASNVVRLTYHDFQMEIASVRILT